MTKKAEMAIATIIAIVLGLVVLTIIIYMFKQQVTKGASGYEELQSGIGLEASNCFNFIEGRSCAQNQCPEGMKSIQGKWKDCTAKGTAYVCCKKN